MRNRRWKISNCMGKEMIVMMNALKSHQIRILDLISLCFPYVLIPLSFCSFRINSDKQSSPTDKHVIFKFFQRITKFVLSDNLVETVVSFLHHEI